MSNREDFDPNRPQDPSFDGKGWSFELQEHGGIGRDCMPQAIKATDGQGRSRVYVPIEIEGEEKKYQ